MRIGRGSEAVEKWGIYEIALEGPRDGNPFADVSLYVDFRFMNRVVTCRGFYDGDGVYRARLMPDAEGIWEYSTRSNVGSLNGHTGRFECVSPSEGNHGSVRVCNQYHFSYQDGTPYRQIGTTCYAWIHQGDALEQQTLNTLKSSPFNKIRMCVFPKHYHFNNNEPELHAFEGSPSVGFDFTRFNPAFFRHLETRVGQLMDLGIEADLILFHPYDRWGFAAMPPEVDDAYLRYVVARLASFRNVWWSMANEWDFMKTKSANDFDRYFRIVQEEDPYGHLRSIHNGYVFYDHSRQWVTHLSVQRNDLETVVKWRSEYGKPVIVDECGYEGNIDRRWGNLPATELVQRFWLGTVSGGYVGHGETYMHPDDILWWAKGGVLYGESPQRIQFLKDVLDQAPIDHLDPIDISHDDNCAGKEGEYYLFYYGFKRPSFRIFSLPVDRRFRADIIDTWEMTITPVEGEFSGTFRLDLPGKSYIAVRFERIL